MTENYEQYLDWVVYQIYPKSFYDTDGDGVGDLRGVIEKLDYIRSLGANAIWLCPIYESPQKDNGYDISNYRKINPIYGDMRIFEELVSAAHGKGLKIIMDFVANHTSDKHSWFVQARSFKENPYHDYYYWRPRPLDGWQSVFGGSAWEYNPPTDEYYLHSFAIEQPDVNWTNEKVRKEYQAIVDFWVDKGVDGFRCDVLDFISKDFEAGKTSNGPLLHEYIRELFNRDNTRRIFTVGECWGGDVEKLCGEGRGELKTTFQFDHISVGQESRFFKKGATVYEMTAHLSKWQRLAAAGGFIPTLFTDNHDQNWLISRIGNDKEKRYECATAIATAVYALRGIPFLYQGQEIGAVGSYFENIEDFDDVETLRFYEAQKGELPKQELMEKINFGSRDNSRRPFAWNGGETRGFTTAKKAWLACATRSGEINLEADEASDKSVVKYYRDLFALRKKSCALRRGDFTEIKINEGCFAYARACGNERLLVVVNFEKEQEISGLPTGKLLLGNLQERASTCVRNSTIIETPTNRIYAPFEAAIYKIGDL